MNWKQRIYLVIAVVISTLLLNYVPPAWAGALSPYTAHSVAIVRARHKAGREWVGYGAKCQVINTQRDSCAIEVFNAFRDEWYGERQSFNVIESRSSSLIRIVDVTPWVTFNEPFRGIK